MNPYKVTSQRDAIALGNYWRNQWQIVTEITNKGTNEAEWYEVAPINPHTRFLQLSLWREFCDAFMAGRMSV